MSVPTPRPPPRKGPNPFLLIGLLVIGTAAFVSVAERRKDVPLAGGRKMAPSLTLPTRDRGDVEDPVAGVGPDAMPTTARKKIV